MHIFHKNMCLINKLKQNESENVNENINQMGSDIETNFFWWCNVQCRRNPGSILAYIKIIIIIIKTAINIK